MAKPQQPELARSGRGETDPVAPTPEDNRPGHHPDQEQDKPDVRVVQQPRGVRASKKKAPGQAAPAPGAIPAVIEPAAEADASEKDREREEPRTGRFPFKFDPRFRVAGMAFGVVPQRASVEVADGQLRARFGFVRLSTPLSNIAAVEITGPYFWPKVIGGPRLSFADRGLTFATNAKKGVCILFKQPVSAGFPLLRHPGLTVTVADPEGLAALLRRAVNN
jgi:hypothetical protein